MKTMEAHDRQLDHYLNQFGQLFKDFSRDVLADQADHYMTMVGFQRLDGEPLRVEHDPDLGEREGATVLVCKNRNAADVEFIIRFSFHPPAGLEFNVDFEEAGMLIHPGPSCTGAGNVAICDGFNRGWRG
jgi:hypothetical protein